MSEMRLTAGRLDAEAEHVFTYGSCAGLAVALHDRTGWPLIKVTDADAVFASGESVLTLEDAELDERANTSNVVGMGVGGLHWMVLRPDGLLVDVRGAHQPTDVVEDYDSSADQGVAALGRTSRADATDEYLSAKGEPVSMALVRSFVDVVLARADSQPNG